MYELCALSGINPFLNILLDLFNILSSNVVLVKPNLYTRTVTVTIWIHVFVKIGVLWMILFNLCRCLGEDATSTSIKERRDIEIQSAHESVSNVPDYSQCLGHRCSLHWQTLMTDTTL